MWSLQTLARILALALVGMESLGSEQRMARWVSAAFGWLLCLEATVGGQRQ